MDYIMGVDGSTTNTGVSVFKLYKNGKIGFYKVYLISAPKTSYHKKAKQSKAEYRQQKHEQMEYRLNYMANELLKLVDRYKPGTIIMEDTYGKSDMNTLKMLCRLQGVMLGEGIRRDMYIHFVSPSTWRMAIGLGVSEEKARLKREELKSRAIAYVKDKYGIAVTDDEADSICIGSYYSCL